MRLEIHRKQNPREAFKLEFKFGRTQRCKFQENFFKSDQALETCI